MQRKLHCLVAALILITATPEVAPALGDGDLDSGFGGGDGIVHDAMGGANAFSTSGLHVGANGDFTLAGSAGFSSSSFYDLASCLLGRDGNIQDCTTFGFDYGSSDEDFAYGISYQLDGRRVLVGSAAGSNAEPETRIAALGLLASNTPDPGFSGNGKTNLDFAGNAAAAAGATRGHGDGMDARPQHPGPGLQRQRQDQSRLCRQRGGGGGGDAAQRRRDDRRLLRPRGELDRLGVRLPGGTPARRRHARQHVLRQRPEDDRVGQGGR